MTVEFKFSPNQSNINTFVQVKLNMAHRLILHCDGAHYPSYITVFFNR
jgi:hypothetical protein